MWVDGLGEVAAHNADLPLTPASNQKLFTAMGVLSLIPQTDRLVTEVRATGAQEGRILTGDLYLVGGGDPTLDARGPHSLDDLAAAVKARGIDEVRGTLVGDETRYDNVRGAPGWLPQHVPMFIGPLSALVVDRNQLRPDADYAANPLPGTLPYFRAALLRAGVRVAGPNVAGAAPAASAVLAALASPPVGDLVGEMLNQSDNLIAELLVKEVGYRAGRVAPGLAPAPGSDRRRVSPPSTGPSGVSASPWPEWRPTGRACPVTIAGPPGSGARCSRRPFPGPGPSGSSALCRWAPAPARWPAASPAPPPKPTCGPRPGGSTKPDRCPATSPPPAAAPSCSRWSSTGPRPRRRPSTPSTASWPPSPPTAVRPPLQLNHPQSNPHRSRSC